MASKASGVIEIEIIMRAEAVLCRAAIQAFVETNVPPRSDGQVTRVATRFGLVGVTGDLSTSYGLTGWRAGEAICAAREALTAWIDARGGVEPSETAAAIAAVRHFVEAHGDARFERVGARDDNARSSTAPGTEVARA